MKNFIILFAVVGVCALIGANFYSSVIKSNGANADETVVAGDAASTAEPLTLNVDELKALGEANPTTPSIAKDAVQVEPVIYGDTNAPIIIEEVASFTCSHCANFYREKFDALKRNLIDTNVAQLHFYSHVNEGPSADATLLVQCQDTNEKRQKLVGALLRGQEQWVSSDYLPNLKSIARVSGMSDVAIDACLADEAAFKRIIDSRQPIVDLTALEGTPHFRIGSQTVKGWDVADFEKAIRESTKAQ